LIAVFAVPRPFAERLSKQDMKPFIMPFLSSLCRAAVRSILACKAKRAKGYFRWTWLPDIPFVQEAAALLTNLDDVAGFDAKGITFYGKPHSHIIVQQLHLCC
jgi:hypothetical protein